MEPNYNECVAGKDFKLFYCNQESVDDFKQKSDMNGFILENCSSLLR